MQYVMDISKKMPDGAGSRGGKIIGHTKSGHAIYESHQRLKGRKVYLPHDMDHKGNPIYPKEYYEPKKRRQRKASFKHVEGGAPRGKHDPLSSFVMRSQTMDVEAACDLIIKAGEGSKGGKVIGHTQSGKPIYASAGSANHKEFSAEDHRDASRHHSNQRNEKSMQMAHTGNSDGTISQKQMKQKAKLKKEIEKHAEYQYKHQDKADKLEGRASSSGPSQKDFDRADRKGDKDRRSRGWGRKSLDETLDDLIKSGEGSRGGAVVGHTASGKAIYKKNKADFKPHIHKMSKEKLIEADRDLNNAYRSPDTKGSTKASAKAAIGKHFDNVHPDLTHGNINSIHTMISDRLSRKFGHGSPY